jgi:hypothetical protein
MLSIYSLGTAFTAGIFCDLLLRPPSLNKILCLSYVCFERCSVVYKRILREMVNCGCLSFFPSLKLLQGCFGQQVC